MDLTIMGQFPLDLLDKKLIVIYHNDLDGVVGTLILKKFLKNEVSIFIQVDYSKNEANFEELFNLYKNQGYSLLVTDYTFPIEDLKVVNMFHEAFDNVYWFDHHQSNLEKAEAFDTKCIDVLNNFYIIIDTNSCGTELLYNAVIKCLAENDNTGNSELLTNAQALSNSEELIAYVKYQDTYSNEKLLKPENINGLYLNEFANNTKIIDIDNDFLNDLLFEPNKSKRKTLIDMVLRNGKLVYEAKVKMFHELLELTSYTVDFKGFKWLVCPNFPNNRYISPTMYEVVGGIICLNHNPMSGYYYYSLTAIDDDIDVSKIATKYHGGGHKQAAGFKLKTNLFKKS